MKAQIVVTIPPLTPDDWPIDENQLRVWMDFWFTRCAHLVDDERPTADRADS